ncbi:MAG: biotin/lipoate A/B protein ligase family protein [Micromonosporaceae bacterium]
MTALAGLWAGAAAAPAGSAALPATAPWRLLVDDDAGAAEGLALDEALMARYARGEPERPPTLRLYTYRTHCALIGRYQNLEAEVDLAACRRTGTQVSRRPTGGGAIIMGAGQLGVALVGRAPAGKRPRQLIEELSAALVAGFGELGITASFRGKNDLEAGGRKIAGLGLYVDQAGAMLFHASVLADLDIPFMLEVLRIPAAKLAGKAAAAVAERVTTVTIETGRPHDAATLRHLIAAGFATAFGATLERGSPDAAECALAAELATSRYSAPSWLGERSVAADGSGSALFKTPAGLARVYLTTQGDLVKSAVVVGDFNELPPAVMALESALRWRRLDERAITKVVARSGADSALGVPARLVAAAVLDAGRQASQRAAAAPVRAAGSCYFPEQA